MMNKHLTTFRGLVCVILSLIIVCGTAVSSFPAVTVNLAETGTEVTSGSLDTDKTYHIGSNTGSYTLVYSNNEWRIKDNSKQSNQYLRIMNAAAGPLWSNLNMSTSLTVSDPSSSGVTIKGSGNVYVTYNSDIGLSSSSAYVHIYDGVTTPSYSVTFNANGGTGSMSNQTITGTDTLTANTFTHDGYTFTGWNTAADGSGTSYTDQQSVNPSGNLILYAQWEVVPSGVTLYFTRPFEWNNLKAYLWKGDHNNGWPGVGMDYAGTNSLNEAIFSITVDPDEYEYVIFNSDGQQTVDINIADAVANGSGIYCLNNGNGYDKDGSEHYYVNFYNYDDTSSTGDPGAITYTKQIEKLNPASDNYDYRLHLTMDGSKLISSTTQSSEGDTTGIVLLIQISDDVNATSFSQGKSKLAVINEIVNEYLDECNATGNKMSVVLVTSNNYDHYDNITTVKSDWNSNEHVNLNSSSTFGGNLTAGLMKATGLLGSAGTDKKAVVYITVKDPQFTCVPSTGMTDRTNVGNVKAPTVDYVSTFLNENNDVNLYILDVANEGGAAHDIPHAMGEKAEELNRGQYYLAASADELEEKFNTIIETIIPGDKTSGITITDTLSKYVDFASNRDLTATLYTEYNSTSQRWSSTENVSSYVRINGDTVTFSRAAEIEGPFKIEIAFNIKTADGVLKDTNEYGPSGYPNSGDEGTDWGTNTTSDGQRGYYANSSATIRYTLNGEEKSGTFIKPVVQAPAAPPVQGSYIFKYRDRYNAERTVTVPVTLNSFEVSGYDGNGNQANVPTYIWNAASQALYSKNPLLTAAMTVQGNIDEELNASVYKNDIAWGISDSGATKIAFDATNHTVTVTATVTPKTFTFKYVLPGGSTPVVGAENIPYGNVATFNSAYNGVSGCHYINAAVPSTVTYWSADAAGTILLTTNRTFGMVIRGGYTETDLENNVVTAYAQIGAVPNTDNKVWKPFVEEATLTRSVDDVSAENKLYADYMINYFNVNGDAVQDLLSSNNSIKYGLIVMKADSAATQSDMESALTKMITAEKTSAYIGDREHIAYRFEYGDATHISNFNRTLYTVSGSYSSLQGKTLTAMAYITIDGTNYFYSAVNTEIDVMAASD